MFMGPLEASKPWSEKGVDAARKWLERVWRLVMEQPEKITDELTPQLDYIYNFTVKKVTEDIETLNFNTAISQMMIFVNDCYRVEKINRDMLLGFVKLLSPFAPHVERNVSAADRHRIHRLRKLANMMKASWSKTKRKSSFRSMANCAESSWLPWMPAKNS
ncbi:MAG: class I tRNA ligase family protein [Holdemania massiliensis]